MSISRMKCPRDVHMDISGSVSRGRRSALRTGGVSRRRCRADLSRRRGRCRVRGMYSMRSARSSRLSLFRPLTCPRRPGRRRRWCRAGGRGSDWRGDCLPTVLMRCVVSRAPVGSVAVLRNGPYCDAQTQAWHVLRTGIPQSDMLKRGAGVGALRSAPGAGVLAGAIFCGGHTCHRRKLQTLSGVQSWARTSSAPSRSSTMLARSRRSCSICSSTSVSRLSRRSRTWVQGE